MMNGKAITPGLSLEEQERQALLDKAIATKVLGGFGQRVHYGDSDFAAQIDKLLHSLVAVNAADVECAMVIFKVRHAGKTPEDDTFGLLGGTYGTEPELTALNAIMSADLRLFRTQIAKQIQTMANPKKEVDNEVQDEASDSPGVRDN